MSESSENSAALSPEPQVEPNSEEKFLSENLEKNLNVSQVVASSASEETDEPEKPEETNTLPAAEASSESNLQEQTLKPDAEPQTSTPPDSQDWRPGSRCRAVYSGDGLVYPAVVQWVKGQCCCVRYDDYNNEEEQDVSALLKIHEFIGPSRAAAQKGGGGGGGGRKTDKPVERGAERRSAWREEQLTSTWVRDRGHLGRTEREEKKKDGDKGTNHSFSFFPPFPPPLQSHSGDPQSFVPPPPPPPSSWAGGGVDSASSMLMLWYMCGFHTGSFLAQQAFKSGSKD